MDSHGPWNVKEKGHEHQSKISKREKEAGERELRTQPYIDGSEKGGHIPKNVKVSMTPPSQQRTRKWDWRPIHGCKSILQLIWISK